MTNLQNSNPNLEFSDTNNNANLEFSEDEKVDLEFSNQDTNTNLEFTEEKQQVETENASFQNIFNNKLFGDEISSLDFNTAINFSETMNDIFLSDEDFNYADVDFNIGRNLFQDITQEKKVTEEVSGPTPAILNFLTMYSFLSGDQQTDMGFSNKPLERPNDLREINKLFKDNTGYTWNQFNNNNIPRNTIESEEFQTGLNKIKDHYIAKGFAITDVQADDEAQLNKLGKSLGIEVGGGIAADVALAPLLVSGPYGVGAYLVSQFSIGYGLNINAQKVRIGEQNLVGDKEKISQAEAIAAGLIQMIPFGVTAKGWKGVRRSFVFGSSLSTAETFTRDILGDEVTADEYWLSLGLGGTFGASFKGAVEGLDKIFTKYKGKSVSQIDQSLTQKESTTIDNSIKIIDEGSSALNTKIENSNVDKLDLETTIKKQAGDGDSIPLGSRVKASDRGNIGTVVGFDDTTKKFSVSFKSKKGMYQTVKFDQTQLTVIKKGKVLNSDIDYGAEVNGTRTYTMPLAYKNTKPNYGSAKIVFESDFDKMAYSLRLGKKAPDTQFKIDKERKILESFTKQGFTEREIRLHGAELHKKIKSLVTEQTGSATATPANTKGLILNVEADGKYKDQVNTVVKTNKKKKLDLGDREINPTKVSFIEDNPNLKDSQAEFLAKNVKNKKEQGTFPASMARKPQEVTKKGALDMVAGNKTEGDNNKISLESSEYVKELSEIKAKIDNEIPDDELVNAQSQSIILRTENVSKINKDLMDSYKTKNPSIIQPLIDKLIKALDDIDDWLTMGLAKRTNIARAFKAMGMKPDAGLEGKTVPEIMDMSAAQKGKLRQESIDISPVLTEVLEVNQVLKKDMLDALKRAEQTGDWSQLIKQSMVINDISGDPRKMVTVKTGNLLNVWKGLGYTGRVLNEIGINAVLSGPSTQKVNLFSGLAMTFMRSLNNFAGANNMTELRAAKQHMFALFYNLDFAAQTWKRSWDMEDNFVNVGNMKGAQNAERFMIASDTQGSFGKGVDFIRGKMGMIDQAQPFYPFNAIDFAGKTLRLPSRLMTANDALIQTPNIIAATAYYSFNEGMKKGLAGQDLNRYIKSNIDGVISYLAKGQKGPIGRLEDPKLGSKVPADNFNDEGQVFIPDNTTAIILAKAKQFGKEITFTQDIRTEDAFGQGAEFINNMAIKNPLVRFWLKFTRSPTNMFKEAARYLPYINTPMVVRFPDQLPVKAGFGIDDLYQNRMGGKRQNLNFINEILLPEIRADLASPDPFIRQNTIGQIRVAYGLGSLLLFSAHKSNEDPYNQGPPPHMFTTGGGPNFYTKDGAAEWISKYKNGWRPYSVATLQYDEDGEIVYRNGKPVYTYRSLEGLPDPLASLVRQYLDFVEMAPLSPKDKDVQEYLQGWVAFLGRNMFNKTYTMQVNELINIMASVPDVGDNPDPEEGVNYRKKRFFDYVGRQVGNSILPYSSLLKRIARTPTDVLNIMGINAEDAKFKAIKDGDYSKLKWFLKPDTSTRAGDTANEDVEYGDAEFNKVNAFLQAGDNILNKIKESVGWNVGGKLPPQVEHITNEFVTYPERSGFELFSTSPISESKNFRYYEATELIGRLLSPPPEVIRGSQLSVGSANFVPKKLDKFEYNKLKIYTNTVEINAGFGPNKLDIKQAINRYIDSDHYGARKLRIEKEGRDSDSGKLAAEEIFLELNKINTMYIRAGINEYVKNELGDGEVKKRLNAKSQIKKNYLDKLREDYKEFNLTNNL